MEKKKLWIILIIVLVVALLAAIIIAIMPGKADINSNNDPVTETVDASESDPPSVTTGAEATEEETLDLGVGGLPILP